ncbi:MAG: hypothetical protein ACYDBX_04570 [Patescibacteria group bacterium]
MIIIIEQADFKIGSFPTELLDFGKFHAKLIVAETKQDAENNDSYIIAKSIYAETGNKINKSQLLELIDKAL